MAVRGEVIVRVHWADPERSGLRTLRFNARSLEEVCQLINTRCRRTVEGETAPPEPRPAHEVPEARIVARLPRPRLARLARDRDGASESQPEPPIPPATAADGRPTPNACQLVAGTVEWVGDVPAGRLLPAVTLLQVRARDRRVVLRLPGTHQFEVGARAYLSGMEGLHTMLDAELVSGTGEPPFFFEVRQWSV